MDRVATINKISKTLHSVLHIISILFFLMLFTIAYIIHKESALEDQNIENYKVICQSVATGSNIADFITKAQEFNISYSPPSSVQPRHRFKFNTGIMRNSYCFVKTKESTVESTEFEVHVR
jgi:hypothetical protein